MKKIFTFKIKLFLLLFFIIHNYGYSSEVTLPSCSNQPVLVGGVGGYLTPAQIQLGYRYAALCTITDGWVGAGSVVNSFNTIYLTPISKTVVPNPITINICLVDRFGSYQYQYSYDKSFSRAGFCQSATISGKNNICLNIPEVYKLSGLDLNTIVNWSLSNPSAGNIANLPNNEVSLTLTTNEEVDLIATLTSECSQTTIKKFKIVGGIPVFKELVLDNNLNTGISPEGVNSSVDLKTVFSVGTIRYEWEKITSDINWSLGLLSTSRNRFSIYPSCNKDFVFKVRAKNSCGWSDWTEVVYSVNTLETDCSSIVGSLAGDNFIFYPNPVTNNTLNISVQQNAPWFLASNNGGSSPISVGIDGSNLIYPIIVAIYIYDQGGNLVQTLNNISLPSQIDLSSLPANNYLVQIDYNGQIETQTIIKN